MNWVSLNKIYSGLPQTDIKVAIGDGECIWIKIGEFIFRGPSYRDNDGDILCEFIYNEIDCEIYDYDILDALKD